MSLVLCHDDGGCTAPLVDGFCSVCGLSPDMQSTCFREVPPAGSWPRRLLLALAKTVGVLVLAAAIFGIVGGMIHLLLTWFPRGIVWAVTIGGGLALLSVPVQIFLYFWRGE